MVPARLLITLAFTAFIVALSLVPGRARPGDNAFVWLVAKTPPPIQKAFHVILYAALTLLWVWTLEFLHTKTLRVLVAIGIALCLGAVLEWSQTRIPGRFGTLTDLALNAAGAAVGVLAAVALM